jgi:hypothetical protein
MSANPLPETIPQSAVPADDLEARVRELAAKYPVSGAQDVRGWIVDREWLADQQLKGAFDAYYGKVVAVYNRELIGVGDNYYEMLLELSPKYNVHPERIVGVYLGDGGEMRWSYEDSPATVIPPEPELRPNPKIQAQVAELRELENQFPVPTWDEVKADWLALYAAANEGAIHEHCGRFVAFCEGRLVGVGDDQLELRIQLARELQRHPERFAITFHG